MSPLGFKARVDPWVPYLLHAITYLDPYTLSTLSNIIGSWSCTTVAEDKP